MLTIQPIKAFNDNYIWAIINPQTQQVVVVDSGQAQPVIDFINATGLELIEIWITHKHHDHTGGVASLQQAYPQLKVIAHQAHGVAQDMKVGESDSSFQLWGNQVTIWHIAGHTEHHLAYLLNIDGRYHVFCGDTLFSAGCGRVFTGDMQAMFNSLQRLAGLADDTLFYPAHEYTLSNLKFGLYIEPNNPAMQRRQQEVQQLGEMGKASLPSSLSQEKQTNVFLRVTDTQVVQSVADKTPLANTQAVSIFTALRQLKDNF